MTEIERDRLPSVAVDLDGVLAKYDCWRGVNHIGDPLPGAIEFVKALSEKARVIVHTARVNRQNAAEGDKRLLAAVVRGDEVRAWLLYHGFVFDDVWVGEGKPIAAAYVDDRAVACVPMDGCAEAEFRGALERVLTLMEIAR